MKRKIIYAFVIIALVFACVLGYRGYKNIQVKQRLDRQAQTYIGRVQRANLKISNVHRTKSTEYAKFPHLAVTAWTFTVPVDGNQGHIKIFMLKNTSDGYKMLQAYSHNGGNLTHGIKGDVEEGKRVLFTCDKNVDSWTFNQYLKTMLNE